MEELFGTSRSIIVIQCINRIKGKHDYFIHLEKIFDKIQYSFMIFKIQYFGNYEYTATALTELSARNRKGQCQKFRNKTKMHIP